MISKRQVLFQYPDNALSAMIGLRTINLAVDRLGHLIAAKMLV